MQLMHWFCEYQDGTKLNERTNHFYDIDKPNVKYFGLEGMGVKFTHELETGTFKVNENNITFKVDDKEIGIGNDIINYKKATHDILRGGGAEIEGYFTGFKEKRDDFTSIEVLFWVDTVEQKVKLRVRLTPLKEQYKFTMDINGVINDRTLKFNEIGKKGQFVFDL